jgi:hypothetical protein
MNYKFIVTLRNMHLGVHLAFVFNILLTTVYIITSVCKKYVPNCSITRTKVKKRGIKVLEIGSRGNSIGWVAQSAGDHAMKRMSLV